MNSLEFQNKIKKSDTPLVVDFWAPWCVPCKTTKPILEKLAEEYAGSVDMRFGKVDEAQEVAKDFRIMGIPTLIAFRDGEAVGRVTGAQNETAYRAIFDGLLEGGGIRVPMAPFERILRLGAGTVLGLLGLNTNNWWLLGIGAVIAFLGIYDRCPVWAALTTMSQQEK
jgi:thioredoxin 1